MKISPMQHPDFEFSLVQNRADAHHFPSKVLAEDFARGIQQATVMSADGSVMRWAVRVGPWMFAKDIRRKIKPVIKKPRWKPEMSWKAEDLARLGKEKDEDIAVSLDCTRQTVAAKRREMGIASGFENKVRWTADMDALIGTGFDNHVAVQLGLSTFAVWKRRRALGIPIYVQEGPRVRRRKGCARAA